MPRWVGLLGSWALLALALGLAGFAIASESINVRDDRRLERVDMIDALIAERTGGKAERIRGEIDTLKNRVETVAEANEQPDTDQTIVVSTAENKVTVRRGSQVVFEASCSTGKGTHLAVDGKTLVFDTPIGKFHIQSKEENPVWVPPDWHYVEQARKHGMRVVRLNYGGAIDADTGGPPRAARKESFWSSLFGGSGGDSGSSRVLRVRNNRVVVDYGSHEQELPAGEMIYAGGAIVIPPVGTPQRQFDKVLGRYRLNLGDGYALHGTQETSKIGQSVTHGCVRLHDADIERLYGMANVGDEVIIY